jgi:uncharacterized small protein (DUF1192 family)
MSDVINDLLSVFVKDAQVERQSRVKEFRHLLDRLTRGEALPDGGRAHFRGLVSKLGIAPMVLRRLLASHLEILRVLAMIGGASELRAQLVKLDTELSSGGDNLSVRRVGELRQRIGALQAEIRERETAETSMAVEKEHLERQYARLCELPEDTDGSPAWT